MFNFKRSIISGFDIFRSYQKQGDEHKKKFTAAGISPQNQETWNLYIQGTFEFEVEDFSQSLSAGQTSLDLLIPEYPANAPCFERVLSPVGVRYCVSADKLRVSQWTRQVVALGNGESHSVAGDSAMIVLSGMVSVDGLSRGTGSMLPVGLNTTITASGPAKIALAIKG